ncbi:lysophospholipid acyltransferase family protein [Sneathiella chinensis]|uniref:1-acyl-sn-glycerol-3-phosphate acyltransferase n=1 Tax=Sneathiella chinensis TaxID=349750 RepID=A0ABQ5TZK6_9PROT|nr:lysophospholipid acyltransferase family protein [Sneathiella chinensis]GLQ05314.1 1-acyl-sn-glycerol-3-phosphate acyltransferase [Sneathiella chinensis]
MTALRSALFFICFWIWSAFMNLLFLPALLFPRKWLVFGQRIWSRGIVFLMRVICNLKVEIRGRENLPTGAGLVASKHQSAFETMVFHLIADDPAMVLKKELLHIPIYGWYCRKTKMIPVDRKGHAAALKAMLRKAEEASADDRPIVIFPEGTRSAVDSKLPYHQGIAALYSKLALPVTPVALNTGLFWPRKKFICKPGTLTIEFLPAIEPGLKRKDFMTRLESTIEERTDALVQEARNTYNV